MVRHEPPVSNDDVPSHFLRDLIWKAMMRIMMMVIMISMTLLVPAEWIFTGAMLWNQWCERKAEALDWEQNKVNNTNSLLLQLGKQPKKMIFSYSYSVHSPILRYVLFLSI